MTFGGTIHPINSCVDGQHGIATWDWPEEVSGMSLKYTVSMAYIEKLFQMETWQENYDLKNNKTFHVSRDGAISIDLNCFTTMNRSEQIRVAKEEEEEGSLTDSEPSAKKREKGKGVGRGDPEGPMPRLWPRKNSGKGRLNKEAGKVWKRQRPNGQIEEVKEVWTREVKPLSRLWPGENSGRGRLNKEAGKVWQRQRPNGQIEEVKEDWTREVKPLSDRITRSATKRSRSRPGRESQVNQS